MTLNGSEFFYVTSLLPNGTPSSTTEEASIADLGAFQFSPFSPTVWYVSTSDGSDTAYNGKSAGFAFATIQHAINSASVGDTILVAPGSYDEAVTIDRPTAHSFCLSIFGVGPKGSVAIAPSASNSTGLTNHADDVSIYNIGCAATGTGSAISNTGSRFRAFGCKIENDDGTGNCE